MSYTPFPVDLLPSPVSEFVAEGSTAIGCDPAYIGLPLLAEFASAIGNSRRVRLKSSWSEPPVLWSVIVGDSGTLKSPAFDLALRPVRLRQKRAMKEHERAMAAYHEAKEQYDMDLRAWRRAKPEERGERPEEPIAPLCERLWCSDTTIEALADRLSTAPRGLLLARDELAGWLSSFNQYRNGQGGDVAHWLEMHRAGALLVDRKTGEKTTIYVPRAAVCIAGGIQPEILRRCLTQEFYDNGLAARLLVAMPPKIPKKWTDAEMDGGAMQAVADLFAELLAFQPSKDVDGDPEPADVELTAAAKAAWVAFYDQHATEQAVMEGELAAAWSKLEGYAARLALIAHCIRQAAGESVDPWRCDAQSMEAGIGLAEWFGGETRRVYAELAADDESRHEAAMVKLIQSLGGVISERDLQRGQRRYRAQGAATEALEALVADGRGEWFYPPQRDTGGQPHRAFRLCTAGDTATGDSTPAGAPENAGGVTVANVATVPAHNGNARRRGR